MGVPPCVHAAAAVTEVAAAEVEAAAEAAAAAAAARDTATAAIPGVCHVFSPLFNESST
jgi:hypothetical protein